MAEPCIASCYPKTAACACGALTVTITAEPNFVHACCCLDCQRSTGSAFSYSAFFSEHTVKIAGESRQWRRASETGRWQESSFCPQCGVTVYYRLQAMPGVVGVSVGCFGDPAFQAPGRFYWSSRRHHWLSVTAEIDQVATQ